MDNDGLFTVPEVADYLKVDAKTIYRLLRLQKLDGFKVGSQWRIRTTDLERFIDSARNKSKEGDRSGNITIE